MCGAVRVDSPPPLTPTHIKSGLRRTHPSLGNLFCVDWCARRRRSARHWTTTHLRLWVCAGGCVLALVRDPVHCQKVDSCAQPKSGGNHASTLRLQSARTSFLCAVHACKPDQPILLDATLRLGVHLTVVSRSQSPTERGARPTSTATYTTRCGRVCSTLVPTHSSPLRHQLHTHPHTNPKPWTLARVS
jgi:hypothetical protein